MIPKQGRFKKGRGETNRINTAALKIFVIFIFGYLAFSNWRLILARFELGERLSSLKSEAEKLESKNMELQARIGQVTTDEYAEKTARERLNLKKPGENVVVVLQPEAEDKPPPKKNFWQRILETIPFLRD